MRYLLDTCTAIWFFEGHSQISPKLKFTLTDPAHELFFSDVSLLEIVIKHQLGKFPMLKAPSRLLPTLVRKHSMNSLPITSEAIFQLENLPLLHQDPFDRLLVAQASLYKLTLVTPDPLISRYDVPTLW